MLDERLSSIGFLLLGLSFAELATEVTDQIKSVIHSLIKSKLLFHVLPFEAFFKNDTRMYIFQKPIIICSFWRWQAIH